MAEGGRAPGRHAGDPPQKFPDLAASAGPEIERLISLLSKLPGLGPRSARRAALALLKRRDQLLSPLADALAEAAARVKVCATCGSLDTQDPCAICADQEILQRRPDLRGRGGGRALGHARWASAFRGRYHVLGGLLSALDGVGPRRPAGERPGRWRAPTATCVKVILARCRPRSMAVDHGPLPGRPAGRRADVSVTMLARGVPVGGELDWLDDGTIAQAMRARRPAGAAAPSTRLRTQHERIADLRFRLRGCRRGGHRLGAVGAAARARRSSTMAELQAELLSSQMAQSAAGRGRGEILRKNDEADPQPRATGPGAAGGAA